MLDILVIIIIKKIKYRQDMTLILPKPNIKALFSLYIWYD